MPTIKATIRPQEDGGFIARITDAQLGDELGCTFGKTRVDAEDESRELKRELDRRNGTRSKLVIVHEDTIDDGSL